MWRKKSIVWDHFNEIKKGKKAKCLYCPQFLSISGGSVGNLLRHMRNKHPSLLYFLESKDTFDFSQYSQEFLTEVIEIYKNNPCLWNVLSSEYQDPKLKGKAFETLVIKFKENDSHANRDTVIRTISHMRNAYQKELKKIKEFSLIATENDVYASELWYFDLLQFLQDIVMSSDESSVMDATSSDSPQCQDPEFMLLTSGEDCNTTSTPVATSRRTHTPAKRKTSTYTSVQDLLGECMSSHMTDRFEYLAKGWAMTMRTVEREQQIFAERLISEVLCEAQLGSLSRESALCTRINT